MKKRIILITINGLLLPVLPLIAEAEIVDMYSSKHYSHDQ